MSRVKHRRRKEREAAMRAASRSTKPGATTAPVTTETSDDMGTEGTKMHKLRAANAHAIKQEIADGAHVTPSAIKRWAKRYGVSFVTIEDMVTGKTYRTVKAYPSEKQTVLDFQLKEVAAAEGAVLDFTEPNGAMPSLSPDADVIFAAIGWEPVERTIVTLDNGERLYVASGLRAPRAVQAYDMKAHTRTVAPGAYVVGSSTRPYRITNPVTGSVHASTMSEEQIARVKGELAATPDAEQRATLERLVRETGLTIQAVRNIQRGVAWSWIAPSL